MMQRLYVPLLGPTDWRCLLANPITQWKRYRSALEMAVCWESARTTQRGLPPEVAATIDSFSPLSGASLLIGLPEHKVMFEGGGHPSQNDLWALMRAEGQLISTTVEAKAGEKLGDLVEEWFQRENERSRKPERLEDLQRWLGISGGEVSRIRYQLLHRTASALKEAQRFGAKWAVMLVQSFDRLADQSSFEDFTTFVKLMKAQAIEGRLARSARPTVVPLLLGWVTSTPADFDRLGAAV